MIVRKKWMVGIASLVTALLLTACGGADDETTQEITPEQPATEQGTDESTDEQGKEESESKHGDMEHTGSGEVPEGLKEAQNPTYAVGSNAHIEEGHMSGMKGAEATIVGAYDTTVYAVSYTPTTGGERVENHKWVIHEEIKDRGVEPFEPGSEVTLEAEHMKGMKDAEAEIDIAEQTTVYMINFTPSDGGKQVTNHKWVTESELSSKQ